ncbi:MAG: hypothetical protein AUI36_09525 [Cyanobacteria bacterium 13_1_40CM_2_61_4]|nr:MAG: hypothetical protein AUI36_09525 [Cyanobacteria bacterium 13_1_40CM_2_61_4]
MMRRVTPEIETRILRVLDDLKWPNQKQLAEELGISNPTVRAYLWRLEGQKMVERDESRLPHVTWHLTRPGQEELQVRESIAKGLTDKVRPKRA